MKMYFLVSDPMAEPDPFQMETMANGALSMAWQKAQPLAAAARADGTRRVYAAAFRRWEVWCSLMRTPAAPAAPEVVAAYLAELAGAGKSVATIQGALAAILFHHRLKGHALSGSAPAISTVMGGIARRSSRPIKRARALVIEDLRSIVADISGEDVRALRDRALLLLGFFGALRRSELVALDVSGRSFAEPRPEGTILHLSGTKKSGPTQRVLIPKRQDELCTTAALTNYLARTGLTYGPLFRGVSKGGRLLDQRLDATSVRHILKARAGPRYSPHSLRAGFITSAARAHIPEHLIQRTSRHTSADVLRGYIRDSDDFGGCAAARL